MTRWTNAGRWSIGLLTSCALSLSPGASSAAPATKLVVTNDLCYLQICPNIHPPFPTTTASGEPFGIVVAALDASDELDTSFAGTVRFASSDSLATLPADYAFGPADQGVHVFRGSAAPILRTLGDQTITLSDAATSSITQGSLTMTVLTTSVAIPALSVWSRLAFLLGLLGIAWLILSQSRR